MKDCSMVNINGREVDKNENEAIKTTGMSGTEIQIPNIQEEKVYV